MLGVHLDSKLERRLARLAKATNRSPRELARELVAQGLDELADGLIALERLEQPNGWYKLKELEEGNDLEG